MYIQYLYFTYHVFHNAFLLFSYIPTLLLYCPLLSSLTISVLSYQPVKPQMGGALPIQDISAASMAELLPHNLRMQEQHKLSQKKNPAPITLSTRLTSSVPKSPPRWPIRPGVMLHVSNDTKENLTINRMTIKANSLGSEGNGDQFSGQLSAWPNETQTTTNENNLTEISVVSESRVAGLTPLAVPHSELVSFPLTNESEYVPNAPALLTNISSKATEPSTRNKAKRILEFVFKRARKTSEGCTRDSQSSHVGLLQSIWRGRACNKNALRVGAQHRLKGIRCSGSGIVLLRLFTFYERILLNFSSVFIFMFYASKKNNAYSYSNIQKGTRENSL